ncbi:hypothetical protein CHS0354_039440 [Potamilus streckersoni]|uniref:Flavin reductase like domain-containing protein n=1 Tax=Potamilus streckersoni TaxID=2493646 RepID=A0AAE0VME7_9BIVA|nr:hypothetical protein CHS0354_039440 [Potamilus streckersoni]
MAGRSYQIFRFNIPAFTDNQVFVRKLSQRVKDAVNTAVGSKSNEVETVYKSIMKIVPQPVVVVTTGYYDEDRKVWKKRGMTCTSFTNVSFQPPIVSMCLKIPSQMNDLLSRTQHFAVHVLANHQASFGMTFAQHPPHEVCPFESIPHIEGKQGVPVILGSCAVLQCKAHSMHTVGDHNVWYGFIEEAEMSYTVKNPLLYYTRSFRSVGDEIFLQAFEDATLPFEDWTHKSHLRMAWNYIHELGLDGAEPRIKSGIKKYNQQNKDKVQQEYHETVTMFYILMVSDAINKMPQKEHAFEDFLHHNGHLLDRSLMFQYYSQDRIFTEEAKHSFVPPDKKELPGLPILSYR